MKNQKPKTPKPKKPAITPQTGTKPFPVPPSGCPDGWTDNGAGSCVLNS